MDIKGVYLLPDIHRTAGKSPVAPDEEQLGVAVPKNATEIKETPIEQYQEGLQQQDPAAFTMSSYQERFAGVPSNKLKDNTAQLTQKLVLSTTVFDVQTVLGEANGELSRVRIAAGQAKGEDAQKAMALVRKLEKLLSRGRKKNR